MFNHEAFKLVTAVCMVVVMTVGIGLAPVDVAIAAEESGVIIQTMMKEIGESIQDMARQYETDPGRAEGVAGIHG